MAATPRPTRALDAVIIALTLLGPAAAAAQGDPESAAAAPPAASAPVAVMPDVIVRGARSPTTALPAATSTTVIDASVIERRQSRTIFDVVKDAPGVSVDGGPRSTGMTFNIRGFRDNDDVLFKIDGGVKGFEKYRFGSGVFIEPELIKSITVERGPSILTGSGAIGGAVIATTKSAIDLLAPGRRVGGLAKLGYDFNNDERLRMLAVYGRPTERVDVLASVVARDSDDFKLPNGQRFAATANHLQGSLLKVVVLPTDALMLELSRTAYRSGPVYTPFDTNSSNAFVGGYVHQRINDETYNLHFSYEPSLRWLKLHGTLARETTDLNNLMLTGAGESTFTVPCTTTPCEWNPYGGPTGTMTDRWKFDIVTAEVFNESRWRLGAVDGLLTTGLQAIRKRRDLRRLTENPLMNGPDGKYPGGFDEQQPPGTSTSYGAVAQNAFVWSDFTFTPAIRGDAYRLVADGQGAIDRQAVGVPDSYRFTRTMRSTALTWRPRQGAWSFTHRWSEGFKPPLITDYFGMNAASPCSGMFTAAGKPIAPYGCGDLLTPTQSTTHELIFDWMPARWASGAMTRARLTLYDIRTRHLVGASYLAVDNDEIVQPYKEKRRGLELEMSHDARDWYLSFTFSRILARRADTLDATSGGFDFTAGIPGPTAGLSAGYRLFDRRLELDYRIRQVFDQIVLPGATALTESTQYCGRVTPGGVVQAASTVQDVFALWRWGHALTLQLGINNLYNRRWCSNGDELGNIIGLQAPGRSVRASMTVQY